MGRWSIDKVRELFSTKGYTLLSTTYNGVREQMQYRCPNGHLGSTSVFDFYSGGGECPCLSKRKVWDEYNALKLYPQAEDEWDYDLNFPLRPEEFLPGSRKKVWWKCNKCSLKHSYLQTLYAHVQQLHGCPYYQNRVVGYGNDLYSKYKGLCDQRWDWDLNTVLPYEVIPFSHKKVWFKCEECLEPHSYIMSLSDIHRGSKCPYRAGKKAGFGNQLSTRFPDIAKDWDFEKNKKGPDAYTYGSSKKVWFKHITEEGDVHSWKTTIKNRTVNKTNCPFCFIDSKVSKVSKEWLLSFNNSCIIHEYEMDIGENKIRVDGFDPTTNTVYEFLGDYWHGNPKIYNKNKFNYSCQKTCGLLFKETEGRLRLISSCGYNIVYTWEDDYRRSINK